MGELGLEVSAAAVASHYGPLIDAFVVDPADGDPGEAVRALTEGRGADYGLDAGATIDSVQQAFAFTRLGGVVTLTSYVRRDSRVDFPLFDLALLIARRGKEVDWARVAATAHSFELLTVLGETLDRLARCWPALPLDEARRETPLAGRPRAWSPFSQQNLALAQNKRGNRQFGIEKGDVATCRADGTTATIPLLHLVW